MPSPDNLVISSFLYPLPNPPPLYLWPSAVFSTELFQVPSASMGSWAAMKSFAYDNVKEIKNKNANCNKNKWFYSGRKILLLCLKRKCLHDINAYISISNQLAIYCIVCLTYTYRRYRLHKGLFMVAKAMRDVTMPLWLLINIKTCVYALLPPNDWPACEMCSK